MSKQYLATFGSDNHSGVSPEVMKAIMGANVGHVPAYGHDPYTKEAEDLFRQEFGENISVFFVFNGTGGNVAALSSIAQPFHSIIMPDTAHVHTTEVGAVYALTGCKPLLIPSEDGKITPDEISQKVEEETRLSYHSTLPRIVCISQTTEVGTCYTQKEMQRISEACKKHNLLLFVDGCRIFNAAAAQNMPLKAYGKDAGVDVMMFGGTKNGLMGAESIIFFHPKLGENFPYFHKQRLQLASKMRYISVQYIPFLRDEVWKKNAEHANRMTARMAKGLGQIPGIVFKQKVESNQIFLEMPKEAIKELEKDFLFHFKKGLVRLVTSFDTPEKEVDLFVEKAKMLLVRR